MILAIVLGLMIGENCWIFAMLKCLLLLLGILLIIAFAPPVQLYLMRLTSNSLETSRIKPVRQAIPGGSD
ncbi:MAG: hypothetical protein U7127_02250 [Phormidium sp.]